MSTSDTAVLLDRVLLVDCGPDTFCVDVARVGAYKNATDAFTRTDMSAEQKDFQFLGDRLDAFHALSRPFGSAFFGVMRNRAAQRHNPIMSGDVDVARRHAGFPPQFLDHVHFQLRIRLHSKSFHRQRRKKSRRDPIPKGIQSRRLTRHRARRRSDLPFI